MPKIREYPEASQANSNDALILDSEEGTKYIKVSNLLGPSSSSSTVDRMTASGSVAHFEDGADNVPMKDVLVHIEPVQDLHGYDSPWPAGGGKNLLNLRHHDNIPKTQNGITFTLTDDGGIRADGTATAQARLYFYYNSTESFSADVILSCKGATDDYKLYSDPVGSVGANDNKTVPTNTALNNTFLYVASGATMNNVVAYPMIRLATESDSAFAPYSNICPIIGWTGCVISHSGADTTNPTAYSIAFPSEAGTVYGGTLDATKGKLVVDRAMVDPGTLDWENYNVSGTKLFRSTSLANAVLQYDGLNIICSNYPTVAASQRKDKSISIGSNSSVWIIDSNYSNVSEFKAAILGSQLVYELATPITYTLTPQEITSLLGTNNLWADTGDSEVEYRADTKLYIDKKIAELQALILENEGN